MYTSWAFGELPELLEVKRKGQTQIGYPALVDTGTACRIDVFDEQHAAQHAHLGGLGRLFAIALRDQLKFIEKNLPNFQQCALLYVALGSAEELKAQWLSLTIERSCLGHPLPVNAQTFEARVKDAKGRINLIAQEVGRLTLTILTEWAQLQKKCLALKKTFPAAIADIEVQVAWLLPKQFLLAKPWAQLAHYPRYLKAAFVRLEKLRNNLAKDADAMRQLHALQSNWQRAVGQLKGHTDARLDEFAWQLQELRVSLFAQELKTPMPVSVKRLQKAWDVMQQGL
jgi:ATP-dependent helicase HrpA